MTPHTLEEQKALLTAEAEGRVIRQEGSDGIKPVGVWRFDGYRYEVERPLMEEWRVYGANGRAFGQYFCEGLAKDRVRTCGIHNAEHAPFRVVHLREVR